MGAAGLSSSATVRRVRGPCQSSGPLPLVFGSVGRQQDHSFVRSPLHIGRSASEWSRKDRLGGASREKDASNLPRRRKLLRHPRIRDDALDRARITLGAQRRQQARRVRRVRDRRTRRRTRRVVPRCGSESDAEPGEDHAPHIANWLDVFKTEPRASSSPGAGPAPSRWSAVTAPMRSIRGSGPVSGRLTISRSCRVLTPITSRSAPSRCNGDRRQRCPQCAFDTWELR
jgi:hypothetical protein